MASTPPVSFSGLTSGIDFTQVISAMMTLERLPVTQMQNQITQLDTKKSQWQEITTSLNAVQDAISPFLAANSAMPYTATSSNSSAATATAGANALAGTYDVAIANLATSTRVATGYSTASFGVGGAADPTVALQSAKLGTAVTAGTFTLNGVAITVDPTTNSLNDMINGINTNVAGVTASYDASTDRLTLTSANPMAVGSSGDTSNFLQAVGISSASESLQSGSYVRTSSFHIGRMQTTGALQNDNQHVALTQTTGSFRVYGTTVTYDASTDSLSDILNRINQQVTSVQAFYDPLADRVVMVNKDTGSSSLSLQDVSGNLLDSLGLLTGGTNAAAAVTVGKNASFTISGINNGNPITSSSNTVTDAIPGVTLQLLSAGSGATTTLTIQPDLNTYKSRITNFVDKYNSAVSLMYSRLTEQTDTTSTTGPPTTGLLNGDSTLFNARTSLISDVSNPVTGLPSDTQMLAQIGITLNNDGTLSVDDGKLTTAIQNNPSAVANLFFDDTNNNGIVDGTDDGIAVRLKNQFDMWLSTLPVAFQGNSIPSGTIAQQARLIDLQEADINQQIANLNDRLTQEQASLQAKFNAVEQQISYLQQRLGSSFATSTSSTGSGTLA